MLDHLYHFPVLSHQHGHRRFQLPYGLQNVREAQFLIDELPAILVVVLLLTQRSQLPPLQEVLGCLDLLPDVVIKAETYGLHKEGISCLSLLLFHAADHVLEDVVTFLGGFDKQASDHLGVKINFIHFSGYSVQDKVQKEGNEDRFEDGRG